MLLRKEDGSDLRAKEAIVHLVEQTGSLRNHVRCTNTFAGQTHSLRKQVSTGNIWLPPSDCPVCFLCSSLMWSTTFRRRVYVFEKEGQIVVDMPQMGENSRSGTWPKEVKQLGRRLLHIPKQNTYALDMDKSWITKSRLSPEYDKGLNQFLDFAFANTVAEGYEGYTSWVWHGESMIGDVIDTLNEPRDTILLEGGLSSQDLMQDMVHDAFGVSMARPKRLRISHDASQCSFTNAEALNSTSISPSAQGFGSNLGSGSGSRLGSAPTPTTVVEKSNKYWKVDIIDDQGVTRKGRLKVHEVWSLPAGQRVVVDFNAQGQPIGDAGGLIGGFLGLVATNVTNFPITYRNWKRVPESYKEASFNTIKAKFCLDHINHKHHVLKKLGKNWRNFKSFLFDQCYDKKKTREENIEKPPDCVPKEMWAVFVDYRLDPKNQELSHKNSENRKKLKMPHTCGSKSIARKKHEMEKNLEIENEGNVSAQISEKDSLGQVLGKEKPGRVRGLGFGPSPTQVFGVTTNRVGSIPLDCNANNVVLQEEVCRLKLELQAANQRSNDLEKEMKCATQRSEERDK
ncbi:hypothetical protein G2W53_022176 [Senna tora]|uniref:Transposase n=1 Tax=Senna tora TaxID=362788 RepID=A0A834WIH6_9FABA|nr:hypothetical protein G2W53_022176 [Senna tora]